MPPTPTKTLYQHLQVAHTLAGTTKDPLVASAIRVITDAYTDAVVEGLEEVTLSPQQAIALEMLQRMEDAHLTLFGEPVKPPYHERDNPDHS
jgi:hypothetical protein